MKPDKKIILIYHIGLLVQVETEQASIPAPFRAGKAMEHIRSIANAALLICDGVIIRFGPEQEIRQLIQDGGSGQPLPVDQEIDAGGGMVFPAFCDSHTHAMFPASREQELFDRLHGLSYGEISARGGGILNSAKKMEHLSDEYLLTSTLKRINCMMRSGTGTIEIKSGYGLSPKQEIRILRLIKQLQKLTPVTLCATFLGAHAFPQEFREHPEKYVDQIIEEMLPAIAEEKLAQYADVFCEKGFFSVEQTERIFEAALQYGLRPRIHANQFTHSGAIGSAAKYRAISADHLEVLDDEEMLELKQSGTIATLLPGCAFFMNSPYPPARQMIDAGLPVALATDYNPGTNPSGDMKFVISLACLKMGMSVNEAITAATLNGAAALDLSYSRGTIATGKRADLFITSPIPSLEYIPYAYTDPLIEKMMIGGEWVL